MKVPARDEAAAYYFHYIDKVGDGSICDILDRQREEAVALFRGVPADRVDHRYAPGKWTVKEVLAHLNDTERVLSLRAFWFARALEGTLASFDQEVAARHAAVDRRSWTHLVDELDAIRRSTVLLFSGLPAEAWDRRGMASGNTFSVRALAWLIAGHYIHHATILEERYLRA